MQHRFALWGLALLPVFLAQGFGGDRARGDQVFPSTAQTKSATLCRDGVSCTHFEGYVIVPAQPDASAQVFARPDAVLSADRLYLSDEKTH